MNRSYPKLPNDGIEHLAQEWVAGHWNLKQWGRLERGFGPWVGSWSRWPGNHPNSQDSVSSDCWIQNHNEIMYREQGNSRLLWTWSRSVVSDSLGPHGLQPTRFLCPWDFPARILEWVAISFSRRSFRPRDWTWVSHIVGRRFTIWATGKVLKDPEMYSIQVGPSLGLRLQKKKKKNGTNYPLRWRKNLLKGLQATDSCQDKWRTMRNGQEPGTGRRHGRARQQQQHPQGWGAGWRRHQDEASTVPAGLCPLLQIWNLIMPKFRSPACAIADKDQRRCLPFKPSGVGNRNSSLTEIHRMADLPKGVERSSVGCVAKKWDALYRREPPPNPTTLIPVNGPSALKFKSLIPPPANQTPGLISPQGFWFTLFRGFNRVSVPLPPVHSDPIISPHS